MKANGMTDLLFRGKFGNVIYYVRNGVQCVRRESLPGKKRKDLQERTPKQKAVTQRFSKIQAIGSFYLKYIPLKVWQLAAQGTGKTALNLFNSANNRCLDAEGELVDHERFVFSKGELLLPRNIQIRRDGDILRLQWEDERDVRTAAITDMLCVGIFYDRFPDTPLLAIDVKGVRGDLCGEFRLAPERGKGGHIYCFFAREDQTAFSDCAYFRVDRNDGGEREISNKKRFV